MPESYEQFKAGIYASLRDKVAERLETEREIISNSLLRGEITQSDEADSESNAEHN
jgi:hypothetical protein